MAFAPRKTVIVPVDFDTTEEVLNSARELAASDEALHIVHVLPPLNALDPATAWGALSDVERTQNATLALRKRLGERYPNAAYAVLVGEPGREVAHYAEEQGADLVVIASHGRKGVKRAILGSVAERVVRLTPCPVLVLKLAHRE